MRYYISDERTRVPPTTGYAERSRLEDLAAARHLPQGNVTRLLGLISKRRNTNDKPPRAVTNGDVLNFYNIEAVRGLTGAHGRGVGPSTLALARDYLHDINFLATPYWTRHLPRNVTDNDSITEAARITLSHSTQRIGAIGLNNDGLVYHTANDRSFRATTHCHEDIWEIQHYRRLKV